MQHECSSERFSTRSAYCQWFCSFRRFLLWRKQCCCSGCCFQRNCTLYIAMDTVRGKFSDCKQPGCRSVLRAGDGCQWLQHQLNCKYYTTVAAYFKCFSAYKCVL